MLKTVVKKGNYHDSVVLMLLTNHISTIEGVNKASIMMATPANKDIFKQSGLDTAELMEASANDMVIVADIVEESVLDTVLSETEEFFKKQSTANANKKGSESVKSWDSALKKMPEANLAVISIPGAYAALEADRALDEGLNVFMFSDNVTVEDEKALKEKAHSKGLVVMGPDCGTGIIQTTPVAFTNYVNGRTEIAPYKKEIVKKYIDNIKVGKYKSELFTIERTSPIKSNSVRISPLLVKSSLIQSKYSPLSVLI